MRQELVHRKFYNIPCKCTENCDMYLTKKKNVTCAGPFVKLLNNIFWEDNN